MYPAGEALRGQGIGALRIQISSIERALYSYLHTAERKVCEGVPGTIALATSRPPPPTPLALSSKHTKRWRHFALLHSTFALHARLYGEEEPATAAEMGRPATEVIGSGAGDFRTCVLRPHSIRRSR